MSQDEKPPETASDASVNNLNNNVCSFCDEVKNVTFCRHCGKDFCEAHASKLNPQYLCQNCLTTENFGIQDEPLVDDEGVTHQGRHIRLVGEGWPNSIRIIKDMSDVELENQIAGLQKLLQEAVRTADYARISISAREYERDYRKHSRYVASVKRREKLEQGVLRLNTKQHRPTGEKRQPSIDEVLAKQLNITVAQARMLRVSLGAKM